MEGCLEQAESVTKSNKLENAMLREKQDMMRNELNKLYYTRSDKEKHLENQLTQSKIRLEEFEKVSEELDSVIAQLMNQDKEWQEVYVKQIMSVPIGPKKLTFISKVLQRLEGKIREVTILRGQLSEQKTKIEELTAERIDAMELAGTKGAGMKNIMSLLYEKQDELRQTIRQKDRLSIEYSTLVREKKDSDDEIDNLNNKLGALIIKRQNLENLQTLLAGILERYEDEDALDQLRQIRL